MGELTVIAKRGLTVTVAIAEDVQPAAEVPVTVYEVVVAGAAVAVVTPVTVTPALHEYVAAPEAVSVAVPPGQMVAEATVVIGN